MPLTQQLLAARGSALVHVPLEELRENSQVAFEWGRTKTMMRAEPLCVQ